ncbi:hypothetical protein NC651_032928 [Populus alba x Populus x berolinensis]|nr:hypothetical protein NC651_032928 [Populus alba x Populus x berolinensis]
MAVAGFYRRALPSPPAIEFASPEGKQLFTEALEGGTMNSFFKLISYYQTQSEPAYCGLASLAMTGSGHFSPIGGYHAGKDMVLILDVARFKYPPHWVPLELLWEAMNTIDKATGHHRGFMILSKLDKASSILYTLWHELLLEMCFHCQFVNSCRHKGWSSVANYLSAEVPHLLKSEDVKDVEEVLSVVFKSPPADLREFIKWVAEVRRQDDGGIILSEEEKGRLFIKEEVLKQVQGTELFKYVTRWLISEISTCKAAISGRNNELPEIAANVCCQGAKLLTENFSSLDCMVFKKADVKFQKSDGEKPVTVVSGTVFTDGSEQGVDMLVPLTQTAASSLCDLDQNGCHGFHPSAGDVLSVLIFSLHQNTWSNIKDEKLQAEINSLVSIDNVPPLLQEEFDSKLNCYHFIVFYFFFCFYLQNITFHTGLIMEVSRHTVVQLYRASRSGFVCQYSMDRAPSDMLQNGSVVDNLSCLISYRDLNFRSKAATFEVSFQRRASIEAFIVVTFFGYR